MNRSFSLQLDTFSVHCDILEQHLVSIYFQREPVDPTVRDCRPLVNPPAPLNPGYLDLPGHFTIDDLDASTHDSARCVQRPWRTASRRTSGRSKSSRTPSPPSRSASSAPGERRHHTDRATALRLSSHRCLRGPRGDLSILRLPCWARTSRRPHKGCGRQGRPSQSGVAALPTGAPARSALFTAGLSGRRAGI
jgi:hypothetical protein